jgi:polyisoprenoid-binding protein YceI
MNTKSGTMALRVALILFVGFSAFADTYHFKEQTSQIPYEVISSQVKLLITHPFRKLYAQSDQVTGALLADLADLNQGQRLELSIAPQSLQTTDTNVNGRIVKVLQGTQFPKIQFSSVKTDSGEGLSADVFPFVFSGTLTIANNSAAQSLTSDCRMQGGALVCQVSTRVQPTRFAVPLPAIAGLVTEDRVDISGLITFRAQR